MFIQALLIAAYVSIRQGQLWHGITWGMGYPIVSGIFIGIVLGDPMTGLKAGATINLAYLGWISAGGTQPGNICLAGVWGTSLTVLSGADPSLALTFAIPIGLFGLLIHQLYMTVNVFWVHQCDKYAAEGNMKKIVWGRFDWAHHFRIYHLWIAYLPAGLPGPGLLYEHGFQDPGKPQQCVDRRFRPDSCHWYCDAPKLPREAQDDAVLLYRFLPLGLSGNAHDRNHHFRRLYRHLPLYDPQRGDR